MRRSILIAIAFVSAILLPLRCFVQGSYGYYVYPTPGINTFATAGSATAGGNGLFDLIGSLIFLSIFLNIIGSIFDNDGGSNRGGVLSGGTFSNNNRNRGTSSYNARSGSYNTRTSSYNTGYSRWEYGPQLADPSVWDGGCKNCVK